MLLVFTAFDSRMENYGRPHKNPRADLQILLEEYLVDTYPGAIQIQLVTSCLFEGRDVDRIQGKTG
jgi:hypothetical protein